MTDRSAKSVAKPRVTWQRGMWRCSQDLGFNVTASGYGHSPLEAWHYMRELIREHFLFKIEGR